ncbi:HPF/RaiA family ribosome-associated protein [Cellulomonas phragmiteti]|uniref:Ribosomal subunit interface protein n=1 Tax=Cellulomonas phragmiteti TaxID=478780 RepID=A0ABQ4DMM3_9CELL|nr:HPF/RaiA family ribosome-associated protein [Cellulomonas phragmiteti]GIG40599.1 ribosomal subunit interface protein [Cellulomonas phragmiteti]
MQIIINSDKNTDVDAALAERLEDDVAATLERFRDHLTRVEVHLGDEAAGRESGADIRCTMEARPAGRAPVAVTEHAMSVEEAVAGAGAKVFRLLESTFGRIDSRRGAESIRHLEVDEELT